jgi:hypothetical protein
MSGKKFTKGGKSKNSASLIDGEDVTLKFKEDSISSRSATSI